MADKMTDKVKPATLLFRLEVFKKLDILADAARITQEGKLGRFLNSNTRRDRDALIKSREKVLILKKLKDELFQ